MFKETSSKKKHFQNDSRIIFSSIFNFVVISRLKCNLKIKVVLLCAYEMKEFMKVTSETLFTTSTRYEAESGSNGSCNFVFNSGPQVCSGPSIQNML